MANRDNSGVLFKNDRKTVSNQPDYKGNAQVDNTEYWLAAWIKESETGKYMSLAFTPKDTESQVEHTPLPKEQVDEIPF